MGLGSIFKRRPRPVLAADADAWCGLSRTDKYRNFTHTCRTFVSSNMENILLLNNFAHILHTACNHPCGPHGTCDCEGDCKCEDGYHVSSLTYDCVLGTLSSPISNVPYLCNSFYKCPQY